jgi:hypothetical protein
MNLKLVSAFLLLVGNTLQLCNANSNMTFTDDVVRVRTRREGRRDVGRASNVFRSLTVDPKDRQANVWNKINSMESYKTNSKLFSSTR